MSCIAVGNFDGVHSGHVRIINTAAAIARDSGVPMFAVTFYTNTKRALGSKVKYICDNETKESLLLSHGADKVEFLEFNDDISGLSGAEFIDFLIVRYGMTHIVCGDNFRFGARASCGVTELADLCLKRALGCTVVKTDGISSTVIREKIESGNINEANVLLGYEFSYKSEFVSGNHIGRTIGYPTLNQKVSSELVLPAKGVYVTYCKHEGQEYPAITNIGQRPTVTQKPDIYVETYVIGIDEISESLAESFKRVYFYDRLRDEKKFDNTDMLSAQIGADCAKALELFLARARFQS